MCACGTVCPAAIPSFTPILKLSGLYFSASSVRTFETCAQTSASSCSDSSKMEATCLFGMTSVWPSLIGYPKGLIPSHRYLVQQVDTCSGFGMSLDTEFVSHSAVRQHHAFCIVAWACQPFAGSLFSMWNHPAQGCGKPVASLPQLADKLAATCVRLGMAP